MQLVAQIHWVVPIGVGVRCWYALGMLAYRSSRVLARCRLGYGLVARYITVATAATAAVVAIDVYRVSSPMLPPTVLSPPLCCRHVARSSGL
jgi:hypothetical protein